MVQKTYHIKDYNSQSLESVLRKVAVSEDYRSAGQVLLLIMEQNWDQDIIREKCLMIRSFLPKAEIAGVTHFDSLPQGRVKDNSILTFMFFEQLSFTIRRFSLEGREEDSVGQEVNGMLSSCESPRCLLTLFSGAPRDIGRILDKAEEGTRDIPVFGATAGVSSFFSSGDGASYVFDEEGIYKDTLLAVLFHGRDLHVRVSYNCGWTSVGKPLTITKLRDPYTVVEIDDFLAADLYQRYLGIPWRRNRLAIRNICEFPLAVTDQDGFSMARIPYSWSPEGHLNFAITMHEGQQIRLTYGLPEQIFSEISDDADEFRTFNPQGMLMVVCMNRMIFFGENAHKETDIYRDIVPEAAFLHGNSEIYRKDGHGGEMHSALVAIGFREGEAGAIQAPAERMELMTNYVIPLEIRLMSFMRAVTSDLETTMGELFVLKEHLEDEVERKTRENESLELHVVQTLAEAIDAKDTYTNGHSSRVALYSREIARRAGFSVRDQNEIYIMGLLHDVGKIGVPDVIINKPGKLTDEEFAEIKKHPAMGSRILSRIKEMPKLATGARWHHERYDGHGYPDGLTGTEIPEEARIIAVADAYDAMTSNRSYRRGMDQARVREQIVTGRGKQFDERYADIMIEMIDEDKDFQMREIETN